MIPIQSEEPYSSDEALVHHEDLCVQGFALLAVGVANIVDTEERGKQGIRGCPAGKVLSALAIIGNELLVDLLSEIEDSREVLGNQSGVNGSTTVRKVVRLNETLIVLDGQEVDPVRSIGGCVSRIWGVSEWVAGTWLGHGDIETSGGVRVTAASHQFGSTHISLGVKANNGKNFCTLFHPLQYFLTLFSAGAAKAAGKASSARESFAREGILNSIADQPV